MKKELKIDFYSMITFLIIGYVVYKTFKYFELALLYIVKIGALYFLSNSKYFEFYEVIPKIIVVIIWFIIITKYLINIPNSFRLNEDYTRRFLKKILIVFIVIWFIQIGFRYLLFYVNTLKKVELVASPIIIITKNWILSILGFIEFLIIILGFYKIYKKPLLPTKE